MKFRLGRVLLFQDNYLSCRLSAGKVNADAGYIFCNKYLLVGIFVFPFIERAMANFLNVLLVYL